MGQRQGDRRHVRAAGVDDGTNFTTFSSLPGAPSTMDRLRLAFSVLIVTSLSLGGLTAVDIGNSLRAIDAIDVVERQVSVSVTEVELRDDSFVVTTHIRNPTRQTLELRSARFRIYNGTNERLASGAGSRLDDNGSEIPAKGSLTATHSFTISSAQRENVRAALDEGASLSMNFGVAIGDTKFVVRGDADIDREGA